MKHPKEMYFWTPGVYRIIDVSVLASGGIHDISILHFRDSFNFKTLFSENICCKWF
jgi:hypothetical protein